MGDLNQNVLIWTSGCLHYFFLAGVIYFRKIGKTCSFVEPRLKGPSKFVFSVPLFFQLKFFVVRYTSYSEPLCIQSRKPFPGTFLPENLENFLQKKKFFFKANLDSASKVGNWFHQPRAPPPPPHCPQM